MHSIFAMISDTAISKLGLSVREQRLDSTHVASNIHTHGRIDLFQSTITLFVRSLNPAQYIRLPEAIRNWFEEESNGWFGLGTTEQKKEKLRRLASFLHQLIELFREDKEVNSAEEYGLLVQLFSEHCELKKTQGMTPRKERVADTDTPAEEDSKSDAMGDDGNTKIRSGIEATMSELKGCHGLGKLRVRGMARVRFAVICKRVSEKVGRRPESERDRCLQGARSRHIL